LQGKSDKARKELWRTPKVKFNELVEMMMEADLKRYSWTK
jgi:GDP-D-mannose dehydratase